MNVIRRHIIFIFLCTMITVLFCACGVSATEEPVAQSAEATPQLPVFDGAVTYGFLGDIPVFSGIGRVTNDQGDSLSITVIGQSEDLIRKYFENTRFHFELRTSETSPEVSQEPVEASDRSIVDLMNNEESLLIYLDLPQDLLLTYPKGSIYVEVDPEIELDQYHIYASKNPTSDSIEVDINSTKGSVEGTLYLKGSAVAIQTVSTNQATLEYGGEGYFDLAVRGVDGLSYYTLAGTWTYDAEAPIPTGASLVGNVLWGSEPVPGASIQLKERGLSFYNSTILAEVTSLGDDGGYLLTDVPIGTFYLCAIAPEGSEYWLYDCYGIETVADQKIYVNDHHLCKHIEVLEPENGSVVYGTTPTFTWEIFPDAEYYNIVIHDELWQNIYFQQYTSETEVTLQSPLAEGPYYWSVTAYNKNDVEIAFITNIPFTLVP